jgi:hypothetical protein
MFTPAVLKIDGRENPAMRPPAPTNGFGESVRIRPEPQEQEEPLERKNRLEDRL